MPAQLDLFETVVPFRFRVSLVREPETPYREPVSLSRPTSVVRYLWTQIFHDLDREAMAAVFLDTRNRLIGVNLAYLGTLDRTAVEPRGILVAALLCNAAGIVVGHNHPSGDLSPSAEDILFTRRMAQAAETVGVRLIDHMILGGADRWVSLKERGVW
jgi:DNA repair protein RadC